MNASLEPTRKIVPADTLIELLRRPRTSKVVFTNGVFDVLHCGHVAFLTAARALGDVLVVALNTDDSVRALGKGPDRPINSQDDRAILIAALGCVDHVTLFGEPTPHELIASLLPDVLVKGGDYTTDRIVGREEVEAAGG
jgi:rfaE bifunctional protein nucleotidyltransferase chain/domain